MNSFYPFNRWASRASLFIRISTSILSAFVFSAGSANGTDLRLGVAKPAAPDSLQLSGLGPISAFPNRPAGPFPFQIIGSTAPAENLVFEVSVSNPSLFNPLSIQIEGTGRDRQLRFTPALHRAGSALIRIRALGETGALELPIEVIPEFSPTDSKLPPFFDGAVAWGDADNDGDLDLLLGGAVAPGSSDTTSAAIYSNKAGVIQSANSFEFTSAEAGLLQFVDLNQDGRADVFLTGGPSANPATRLYIQSLNGGFTPVPQDTRLLPGVRRSAAAWTDVDGDGDPDLALTGSSSAVLRRGRVVTYLGGGTFTNKVLVNLPALDQGSVVWADFDGDGDPDLLLNGSFDGTIAGATTALYLNEGDFLKPVEHNFPALFRSSIAVADMNGDGAPDVVMTGMGINGPTILLGINTGTGTFRIESLPLPAVVDGSVALGDLDGDGVSDIVLTGQVGVSGNQRLLGGGLWLNRNGGKVFEPLSTAMPAAFASHVALGDMDQDGDLDLAFTGATNSNPDGVVGYSAVFRNQLNPVAPALPSPTSLESTVQGNDVTLRWVPPSTESRRMTFNLRVGTTHGSGDILSVPTSANGTLGIPQSGNAGWNGLWKLRRLPPGHYFWSIQAVDAAFRGSTWAGEQAFDIVNQRPKLETIPDQTGPMNLELGPVTLTASDPDGDASLLEFEAVPLDETLVAPAGIRLVGSGNTRSLFVNSRPNASGTGTLLVRVRDTMGGVAFQTVKITYQNITESSISLPNFLATQVDVVDFDHDGLPDISFIGTEPLGGFIGQNYNALFRNRPGGRFEETQRGWLGGGPVRGSWGDVDRDGLPEFSAGSRLLLKPGGVSSPIRADGTMTGASAWGDFDGDGRLDLVVVGTSTKAAEIFRNTVNGWEASNSTLVPLFNGSAAWGDLDGDGDLDLAISGSELLDGTNSPLLILYRNDGGKFIEIQRYVGVNSGVLQWADFNQDGRMDLIAAGLNSDGPRERVYINLGAGQFNESSVTEGVSLSGHFPGANFLDFNNDGAPDLIEYTSNGVLSIRLNRGRGVFAPTPDAFANAPSQLLRWLDIDGDGDDDILVSGPKSGPIAFDGSTRVFLNHWKATHPAVQTLETELVEGGVVLKWPVRRGFGAGTPVTYNVRVGTGPGSGDVVSPMSDWATGKRMVAAPGAQGFAQRTQLYGLVPGVYYWSVQAVDSVYQGSEWTAEAQFTILPASSDFVIEGIESRSADSVTLNIRGLIDAFVRLEMSGDLKTWEEARKLRIGPTGKESIVLQRTGTSTFYRLKL